MTYNGVGLTTPRGTGTSGFIQRNAGQLAAGGGKTALMWNTRSHYKTTTLRREKGQDIIEHEQKREIELKLLVEREKMEDEGKLTEEEIEDELTRMRGRFTREQDREVQRQAELPSKSVEDFKKAFKIDKDYSEGQAFDRELQVYILLINTANFLFDVNTEKKSYYFPGKEKKPIPQLTYMNTFIWSL